MMLALIWGLLFSSAATTVAAPPEADADPSVLLAISADDLSESHTLLVSGSLADTAAEPRMSDAQRIARLQRTLDSDQKHLAELQAELANLEKEYQQADTDFKQLDSRLEAEKREVAKPPATPGAADSASRRADRTGKKMGSGQAAVRVGDPRAKGAANIDRHARNQDGRRSPGTRQAAKARRPGCRSGRSSIGRQRRRRCAAPGRSNRPPAILRRFRRASTRRW